MSWKQFSAHHGTVRGADSDTVQSSEGTFRVPAAETAGCFFKGPGIIDRVVRGNNLVYVTSVENRQTLAFTPDCLRLQRSDGSMGRYRGEPLSSLGVQPGARVSLGVHGGSPVVIVKEAAAKGPNWFKPR